MSDAMECAINADTLDTTLDILRSLSGEAKFNFSPDGLTVKLVGPANVAMHNPVTVTAAAFEKVPTGEVTIGVNLERLQDYISKADSDQSVALAFDAETGMFNISYANVDVDLAAIDPDSVRKEPDVNELDLPNTVVVDRGDLADACEVVDMTGDHVTLSCDIDGEFRFYAEGDTDTATWTFGRDDIIGGTINENTESVFSVKYLYGTGTDPSIVKEIPSGEIEIEIGDTYPMFLRFEYADGDASVRTMIAPRVAT